jgi:hypothetical protein
MDRDSEERELERLVFGNDVEFKNDISDFARATKRGTTTLEIESDDDVPVDEQTGLEDLEDGDVSADPIRCVLC